MNKSAYLACEWEYCLKFGHHFDIAGSDKTPLKRNLICRTCSEANPGKTAYVAYGAQDRMFEGKLQMNAGLWRRPKHKEVEVFNDE